MDKLSQTSKLLKVRTLNVAKNRLTTRGVKLLDCINPMVLHLNLSGNRIGSEGTDRIAEILRSK
jgi:Ran GTPase-activating protein (RanGAP) involved in mRNA processing and transport